MMKKLLLQVSLSLIAGFFGGYIFHLLNPAGPYAENTSLIIAPNAENPAVFTRFLGNDTPIDETAKVSAARLASSLNSFSTAASRSRESVVYIKTTSTSEYKRYSWFDQFFGTIPNQRMVSGSGSGVIFTADGYIVTNNHVIDEAQKIEVIFKKRTYLAEVVGTDPSTDLAVLKIEEKGLPAITLGSSAQIEVGDWVLAVGNPFNLQSTITAGIVSAKGRRINILEDVFPIESFIQTDAAINPGNSGGALVDVEGKLVGINTAILSQTGAYAGYGFAVPIDIVKKIVDDLRDFGEVQKAFIGAEVVELDERISDQLKIETLDGVVISKMDGEGTAVKAGLKVGDVIVGVGQADIHTQADFDEHLSYRSPGDQAKITYVREGKRYTTNIELTNIDGKPEISRRETFAAESLGAVFEAVPRVERNKLGVDSGVRILEVRRGLINNMGLKKGNIILSVNNLPIESPNTLTDILSRIRGRFTIQVVDNNGRVRYYAYHF